jgi:uncharacterized protein (DUF58 family)
VTTGHVADEGRLDRLLNDRTNREQPAGDASAGPAAHTRRRAFPLVPRHRKTGVNFGTQRSRRRGQGAELAGIRPYVPGDRLPWIDWYASARESLVKDDDIFLVRQFYAETAPRVIIVVDRRPSMALYEPGLPWLSKPAVVRETTSAILMAARAARAYVGYLDFSGRASAGATAHWISPHRQSSAPILRRLDHGYEAPANSLELAVDFLLGLRSDVPDGAFVFVVSDFLHPCPRHVWSRAYARGWDLVPVIVQDPTWEQSFPPIQGLVVPVTDPQSGESALCRLTASETRARQAANAERLGNLTASFRSLGFDPVVLGTSDPVAIDTAFINWAARRRISRRRAR